MSKHPFELIPITSARSTEKPRATGRTMMIDWGWDIERLDGLLRLIGPYIDMVKLPIGTPRLYEESYLADKVALFHQHQVKIWFGGGFVEHVYLTSRIVGATPAVRGGAPGRIRHPGDLGQLRAAVDRRAPRSDPARPRVRSHRLR